MPKPPLCSMCRKRPSVTRDATTLWEPRSDPIARNLDDDDPAPPEPLCGPCRRYCQEHPDQTARWRKRWPLRSRKKKRATQPRLGKEYGF